MGVRIDSHPGLPEPRVCWELASDSEVRRGTRVHSGLLLTLMARDPRGLAGDPADPERQRTWSYLRDVAARALPADGPWRLRPEPFERAWSLRRGGDWEPEVQFRAALELRPGRGGTEAERRLVSELRRAFEELGVAEAA